MMTTRQQQQRRDHPTILHALQKVGGLRRLWWPSPNWRRPEDRSALQRPCEGRLAYHLNAGIQRGRGTSMSEGAPRELSLAEIDALSMQAIDQITARLPERDYRTPQADDGSSSHVLEFGHGARFEVIYDREGRPVDYRADRVRFERLAGHIVVSDASSRRLD